MACALAGLVAQVRMSTRVWPWQIRGPLVDPYVIELTAVRDVVPTPSVSTTPARVWWWPLLVAAGYLALQVLIAPTALVYPDTARYAQLALQQLGVGSEQARLQATELLCADQAEQARRNAIGRPTPLPEDPTVQQRCMAGQTEHLIPTGSPRYQELFDSRPGYPMVVAALVPLFGLKAALWAVPVGAMLLAGLGVWWLLLLTGLPAGLAAAGQGLLYVLPIGWWGSQMLTEGPVVAVAVAMLLGVVLLGRDRPAAGTVVLGVAVVAGMAVKYSTSLLLAGTLAVAAAAASVVGSGRRGPLALAAVALAGVAVGTLVAAQRLGLPGLADSVQDMLTGHFTAADVADPRAGLIRANVVYWQRWPTLVPSNLALVVGALVAAWGLWRHCRVVALAAVAVAVAALGTTVAHPEPSELDRLYSLAWLLVAVGLPAAAAVRPMEKG